MIQFFQLEIVLASVVLSACSLAATLPASPENPTPLTTMTRTLTVVKRTLTATPMVTHSQTAMPKVTQQLTHTSSTHTLPSLTPTEETFLVTTRLNYQDLANGQYLVVSRNVGVAGKPYGETDLFLMNAKGLFEEFAIIYKTGLSAALTSDGKKLAFTYLENSHNQVAIFDFLKNTYSELPNAGNCIELTWSPVGHQIAMGRCETGITVISIDTGEYYTVTRQDPLAVWHENMPAWSPDGQQIAYFQGPTFHSSPVSSCGISSDGIYVIDNPGEDKVTWNNQRALLIDDCLYGPLAWSPDSQTIAIQFGEQRSLLSLQIYQPWTGLRRTLVNEKGVNRVAWSPDGQQIAFNDWDGNLYLISPDGAEPVLIDSSGNLDVVSWIKKLTFDPGDIMSITPAGHDLNLRDAPSLAGASLRKLQPGDTVTLLEGPVEADGYTWWKMSTEDGLEGWAVEVAVWYDAVSDAGNGGVTTPTP
ncbi:MAG: SH3 domain-containing protein [Chloroflexota bacterium]